MFFESNANFNKGCFKFKTRTLLQTFEMFTSKKFIFCLFLFSSYMMALTVPDFQNINVGAVRCNMSEQFVYKNYSCFAKSFSRNFSTVNIIATAKIPLNNLIVSSLDVILKIYTFHNFQVEPKLLFRYGLIYRDVITFPRMDFCDLTKKVQNNQNLTNRVISSFAKFMSASYPREVHECPYTVL